MSDETLHDDDQAAEITLGDGRVVRNLTPEEYAATYADGTPHAIPGDVLAEVEAEAARIAAAREG
jgi:hypothetical protein